MAEYNVRDIVVLARNVYGIGGRGYLSGQRVKIEQKRINTIGTRYSIRAVKGERDIKGMRLQTTCSPEDIREKVGEVKPRRRKVTVSVPPSLRYESP